MMDENRELEQNAQQVLGKEEEALTRKELQDQLYLRDLLGTYTQKIEKKRDQDRFITFARGIIQEMQEMQNGKPLDRSGDYSYRYAFDLAWEGLFGEEDKDEKEDTAKDEVEEEPKKKAEPSQPASNAVPPTSQRRTPGDIEVAPDGQELESYEEKLGLANYAKARNKLHKMTKTLKTTNAADKGLAEIMAELDKADN